MPKKDKGIKVGTLDDIPVEEFLSTGIPEVDEILGGGFPKRRITQIWGQPGVGKSYLLAKCMAANDGKTLYVDAEFALNKERLKDLGVDLKKIDYVANSQLEEVAELIIDKINDYDLVIIDTLAKLTPMTVTNNEVGTSAIGLAARQISHFEAKLRPKLYQSNAVVIGINQARANFSMSMVQTQPFGGWAWGHTIDLSLKLYKGERNKISRQVDGIKYELGHVVSVKVEKSKVSTPFAEAKFRLMYGDDND